MFAAGTPVFEDLCKNDLEEKAKHADVMKTLYNQGKKTYFRHGAWHVDGKVYRPPSATATGLLGVAATLGINILPTRPGSPTVVMAASTE